MPACIPPRLVAQHGVEDRQELAHDGVGIEEDWLRRIGPAHFSRINFRGTFRFNVERYADVLVERAVGRAAAKADR